MKKLILTSDFSSLINLREEALRTKEEKEKDRINSLIKLNKISPRTAKEKSIKLEKWITKEKADIKKTKKIIEEARKKTEDVIKETEKNGEILKHIMSEKVATPREGLSMRSGMNSSRRRYEQQHKAKSSGRSNSEPEKISSENSGDQKHHKTEQVIPKNNTAELDELLNRYANKEIDLTNKKHLDDKNSDIEGLCSVDTPKVDSNNNSSFEETQHIKLGPQVAEGDSSYDSVEPHFDKNRPINISSHIKNERNSDESEQSEVASPLEAETPQNALHSLSRKKSEQRLKDISTNLAGKVDHTGKSTITPQPQSKQNIINPFNSDNFFTQNFDEQEMEAAIEQLKNSSGKMGMKGNDNDSVDMHIDDRDQVKDDLGFIKDDLKDPLQQNLTEIEKAPKGADDHKAQNKSDETPSDGSWKAEIQDALKKPKDSSETEKIDYNLIKEVEKTKMAKSKDSRNSDIKETKNKDSVENKDLGDSDKKRYYGIHDDVEFLKKNTTKPSTDDSRNAKTVQQAQQKSSKTNESLKEDIILDEVSDKAFSDEEDKIDPNNITGSQSLDDAPAGTPDKLNQFKDSDLESSDKTDYNNSDSKYATVSILSELSKKDQADQKSTDIDTTQEQSLEDLSANKLTDLIYSAMLAEIKAELFPPRPLFLLTADLEKIELEQAMIYLNDMSVEKEAALLKEYLKYSGGEDIDFAGWDGDDKNERESDDSKMFSDSGKLVLYERKGISTDLFSIEKYVDELADEVDDKCKSKFLTDTFSPIKKDPVELLNQLQNSDIGSYDHFETDMGSIAILPLEIYLELEKKRKANETEETKSENSSNEEDPCKSKRNENKRKAKQKEQKLLKE